MPTAAPRSAFEIFLTFAAISLQSFGGALAFIERTMVRDKRWLGAREFVGLFGVCQVLPGPTGVSFCVLLGDRFFGLRGAVAAFAGFLLVPCVLVLAIAALFLRYQDVAQVQGALHGMGAASVGLFMHTALRMSRTLSGEHVGIAVALATFFAVGLLRVPVGWVVMTLGIASVAWAWYRLAP
ncbi:MAG: chromate transporter [Burkholderiaceae bacterium]